MNSLFAVFVVAASMPGLEIAADVASDVTGETAATDVAPEERALLDTGEAVMIGGAGAFAGAVVGAPVALVVFNVTALSGLSLASLKFQSDAAAETASLVWIVSVIGAPLVALLTLVASGTVAALGIALGVRKAMPDAPCPHFLCGPFGRE